MFSNGATYEKISFLTNDVVDTLDLKTLNRDERYGIWKKIPKVELHCHLDICFSLETFLFLLRKYNIKPELSDSGIIDYYLSKDVIQNLDDFVSKTRRITSIYLNYDVLKLIGKEAVYKKYKEGVVLIEFRYSPAYIAERYNLDFNLIHKAFKEGIQEAIESLNYEIYAGLICTGEAGISRESLKSVAEFSIKHKEDFIGFDNAGYEMDLKDFKDIYEELTKQGIPLTIHAGEDKTKPNLNGVYSAIEILKAKRIGHGIRISESEELMKLVKEKNILLEICPKSNILTNNVTSMKEHPIRKLYDNGVKVSVSSDDPGIFLTDINDEYEELYNDLHFNLKDFIKMNYWALEHSFISDDIKNKIKKKYFENFTFI